MKDISNTFARSRAMMAAIGALISQGLKGFELQQSLNEVGQYKSRGKGGKTAHRPSGIARQRRHAMKTRNRARHRRACRG